MPLKKCRECGELVNATWKECPVCHKPLKGRTIHDGNKHVLPGFLVILLIAAAVLWGVMNHMDWALDVQKNLSDLVDMIKYYTK